MRQVAGHRSSGFAAAHTHSKRARLKPRPRLGLGLRVGVVARPRRPLSALSRPRRSPTQAFVLMCAHTHVRLVCGAPLSCVCVFVWRCAIGYVVCERSQMGLKSFYLAVNCHFFFAGLRPAHPAGGHGAPQTPRVRPCSASRSPKRQVRLSAEVTSGRPTSKKTAIYLLHVGASGNYTRAFNTPRRGFRLRLPDRMAYIGREN